MMKYLLNITLFALFVLSAVVKANDVDSLLEQQSQNQQTLQQGQVLFEQVCASCHGKELSGGSGFNLKDAEWVHGSKPSQILSNVKNGFMSAGMPGFGAVFGEQQLQSIVAYILSKREGWSDLSYKLYQLKDENDTEITAAKLIKSGLLPKGLADYSIPEIQHYFIEFEGDFYAPSDIDSQIWLEWGFPQEVFIYVDGKQVEKGGKDWFPTWRLKRGKQHLKITYRSGTNKPNQRNLVLMGTTLDMAVKLFAVSTRAQTILEGKKFEITANTKTVVQRKRIHQLPPRSISVGLPSKINFAFNTDSCAVVGIWQGDMLNIGPNIAGRGEDPSLPLGEWLFKHPEQLQQKDNKTCRYLGYQMVKDEPQFNYEIAGVRYSLLAQATSNQQLTFVVTASQNIATTWQLPQVDTVSWAINNESISNSVHHAKSQQFEISAFVQSK